jgi:fumarate reductase flavoprotein subunit
MVKKYAPYLGEGYRVIGAPGRTGDGINLALEAGAKIDTSVALDTEAAHTMGHNDYRIINRDLEMLTLHILVKTPLLRVNYLGNRFMDESINAFHMEAHSLARNKNMYWVIFDEEIKNALINRGVDELGFPRPIFPMLPDPKLKNLNSALEKAYAKGYAVKANTVDELAKKIGVDPANLKATVARQNELAKQRKDDDYLKNPKFLHNYAKGPFYALKGEHTIISTNGGVQCNEDFQVINENLKPIPGLYVTGVLIGSMVGDTYPMHAAGGTSCGFGVAASRVIVQNIAAQK